MIDVLKAFLANGDAVGFYALSLVAIWASLRVVTHANPVHAILSMIVSLLAVAGIFFIIGAPFAGVLEMIVYAGAILVLFVFVIMMLNLGTDTTEEKTWLTANAWATPFCMTLIIGGVLVGFLTAGDSTMLQDNTIGVKDVGISLFTQYVLLVEVAGFLLLGALVAAYHLGKKALDDENVSHYQDDPNNDAPNRQPDAPVFSQQQGGKS
ncbi:NADH-quinone oxidoreductase subunit J [Moraxella bovis]|uniref:NADH-quinone oxidoreductase subunit J n=1 Tax=Moraxella bovis TaxID=476 RepID=A0AAQ2QA60_MORBO|nr:NADH-quinone oxidoreductase subunit J [Moraxella bovis]AWY20672.1 NADH-quinone oxidoreductase subunit J [Moraxella bovis]UYZ76650.1 NADH-quinone oxidoreductase subunit J [Moraxella bovis]UYZ77397.1 NADH-quinone oxidoreductase subunit J [Moraxella bovis]UYZ82123.1 NADH-quinone oxidoreductase subunit J [Moraxella bovis]UYZ85882.1 NADH-quinone oxidoreductase subunit J [Moraxella bovis]